MIRARVVLTLLVGIAVQTAVPVFAAAQAATTTPAPDDSARARALLRQGSTALRDGKYEDARKALLEAWSIRGTYDVAAILGQAELELKLYRDAAEHLDFAARNFAPRESPEVLDNVKAGLLSAKQQVAELRITVNERYARVSIDGKEVGVSPLAGSAFVEPGPHTIEARLDVDRVATQSLSTESKTAYNVELTIPNARPADSLSPSSGLGPSDPAPNPKQDRGRDYTAPVSVAVAGGVVLITGVALFAAAASKDSERSKALASLGGTNPCGTRDDRPSSCGRIGDLADGATTFRALSYTSFGVAVAAGVATYLLWPSSETTRTGMSIVPTFSAEPSTFQLGAVGRF